MPLHHALDVEPISEKALYVHESDLADPSQADVPVASKAQGKPLDRRERLQLELRSQPEDNVRVYIPLDINEDAILRRLHHIFPVGSTARLAKPTRLRFAAKWKPWSLK